MHCAAAVQAMPQLKPQMRAHARRIGQRADVDSARAGAARRREVLACHLQKRGGRTPAYSVHARQPTGATNGERGAGVRLTSQSTACNTAHVVPPSSKAGTWATGAEGADGDAGCLTRVCQGPPSTQAVILCTEMHRNRIAEISEGGRRGCTCGLVDESRFTTRPAWGQPTSSCGGRRHRLFGPVWPARSSSARLSAPLLRSAPRLPTTHASHTVTPRAA